MPSTEDDGTVTEGGWVPEEPGAFFPALNHETLYFFYFFKYLFEISDTYTKLNPNCITFLFV